jgi:hypothetical protein
LCCDNPAVEQMFRPCVLDSSAISFLAIARKPDFTPEKVAFFLLDPHPKMPNFPLSRNEAADLGPISGRCGSRTQEMAEADPRGE